MTAKNPSTTKQAVYLVALNSDEAVSLLRHVPGCRFQKLDAIDADTIVTVVKQFEQKLKEK